MRFVAFLGALLGTAAGCTAAQLDAIDPVTYVDGETCPDAHGIPQKVFAGYFCCAGPPSYAGPGQCPEGTSCMNTESCSTPLPANDDAFGVSKRVKRSGL